MSFQDDSDNTASLLPSLKIRKGSQTQDHKMHENHEQVISESSLNKLVGAVDTYNLQVMLSTLLLSTSNYKSRKPSPHHLLPL